MKQNNPNQILVIVSIVALVAIGVMLMNISGTSTGQATSALKLSKTASSCSDSDGGKEHYIGGITTSGSTAEHDYCLTATTEGYPVGDLYETYCSASTVAHEIISCEEKYGANYHCTTVAGLGACRTTTSTASATSGGSSGSSGASSSSGSGSSGMSLG